METKHTSILKKEISRSEKKHQKATNGNTSRSEFFGLCSKCKQMEARLWYCKSPTNKRSNAQAMLHSGRPELLKLKFCLLSVGTCSNNFSAQDSAKSFWIWKWRQFWSLSFRNDQLNRFKPNTIFLKKNSVPKWNFGTRSPQIRHISRCSICTGRLWSIFKKMPVLGNFRKACL